MQTQNLLDLLDSFLSQVKVGPGNKPVPGKQQERTPFPKGAVGVRPLQTNKYDFRNGSKKLHSSFKKLRNLYQ